MLPGIGTLNSGQRANPRPGRYGRRKDSAIRTLVAETLVLAKTHGYVEKIENELEEELQQDYDPPKEQLGRWRRKGYQFFKSKYVLLTVVFLCITDCALVLGELTLDLHKVRASFEHNEQLTKSTEDFLKKMRKRHNDELKGKPTQDVFELIMMSSIVWNISDYSEISMEEDRVYNLTLSRKRRSVSNKSSDQYVIDKDSDKTHIVIDDASINEGGHHGGEKSLLEHFTHAFHLSSITILGIILFETILKALCAGTMFFHRRLEVFDAFIVIVSFVVDTVLLVYLPNYNTRDFVFILAILLPWRVIRVVNSLVVAVKDHEHFRLKLVYSRKKKIQNNLREAEVRMQIFKYQCNALRRLCMAEGLDEWKIDQCLKAEQKYQPHIGKRKCKVKIDSSTLSLINEISEQPSSARSSPRPSIPSIDFQGLKFLNGHSLKHNESNGNIDEEEEEEANQDHL